MDYRRIYAEFISDRRSREPVAGVAERHHILPRSLGGSDDADNIVALSPEDHFFAHLLLAKAHGGRLWVPVLMWLGGNRRSWKGRRSRLAYGWAARSAIAANSAEGGSRFDPTVYHLEHKDGRRFSGTQYEIGDALGLGKSGVNLMLKRRIGSMGGWFLQGERPAHVGRGSRKGMMHPMAVQTTITFKHLDGRTFVGTQHELHRLHGISKPSACRLAGGKQTIAGGWYVEGREPSRLGRAGAYKCLAEA